MTSGISSAGGNQWEFDGKVYAGVLVVANPGMAKTLLQATNQIEIPADLLTDLAVDPNAGVERACTLICEIDSSGAFDGVHLVPVGRYRAVSARLERLGWRRRR